MTIRFHCPKCGKKLKSPPQDAGRLTRCTGCGQEVFIPRWQGEAAMQKPDAEHAPLADEGSLDPFRLMPSKASHQEDLIDMTAMVDIVFFMLIFFMVAGAQAVVAVMDVPPAHASQAAAGKAQTVSEMQTDPEFLVVKIEEDDSIWVDEQQVFDERDIRVKLRAALEEDSERRSVLVLGSADASHGALVQSLDACMDAGFDDIRLSVQEPTDDAGK